MLAQLVTKLKRVESNRTEPTTSRTSSRAMNILSSPTLEFLFPFADRVVRFKLKSLVGTTATIVYRDTNNVEAIEAGIN
jgi:hypothetical protein